MNNNNPMCIALVLSPLLALMKNQVSALTEKGVRSIYVTQESDVDDPSF